MVVALYLSHHGAVLPPGGLLATCAAFFAWTVTIGYAAELVMKIS